MNFQKGVGQPDPANRISVSIDFASGGGMVEVADSKPVTIRVKPHNEGPGGWAQVWWYFAVDGLNPGEEIVIQLDRDEPVSQGISPQVFFSYDQEVWGLTDAGHPAMIDGRDFFIYKHTVRGQKAWFAYDLPYTPKHVENLLVPEVEKRVYAKSTELCKTRNSRPVPLVLIEDTQQQDQHKYGIWLQARAHAFESGASWVLHELALWLLSDEPLATDLRKKARIYIVPIVDVDGVVEGRTGKYQKPHDHWMSWNEEPSYWPEVAAVKRHLKELADQNMADLFIDFHGPGGSSHPYFIMPVANKLPHEKQKINRDQFLKSLNAQEFSEEAKQSQSMNRIHYSERAWDNNITDASHEWVLMRTNEHTLAFYIEVNMNTPLSTREGYRAEALTLGKAIARYFVDNMHRK